MAIWQAFLVISLVKTTSIMAGDCPDGDVFIKDETRRLCYTNPGFVTHWGAARVFCDQMYKGDLISNIDPEVADLIRPFLVEDVWVGVNDRNVEAQYSWANSPVAAESIPWAGGLPPVSDEYKDCGAYNESGVFIKNCEDLHMPLCAVPFNGEHTPEPNTTCPDGFPLEYRSEPRKCVALVEQRNTWAEARDACWSMNPNANLVYIQDFQFQDWLQTKMEDLSGPFWTGINDIPVEGRFQWMNNPNPLRYLPWARGEPSNQTVNVEDCVVLPKGVGQILIDRGCNGQLSSICEVAPLIAPTYRCDSPDWALYEDGGQCFKLDTRPRMWQKAREDCISQGGDLASIPDSGTHDFIKANVMGTGRSWIGLKLEDELFKWLGESAETEYKAFRNRPINQNGNEYCVEMIGKHEGKWNDKVCTAKRGYICQKQASEN